MGDIRAIMSGQNEFLESLNANTLFMAQCIIAACIGGLEFCFPALFVDTFNTFEVYTSHRLYGATMIVNAIVVFAMRNCSDPRAKKDIIQAFLFQFGLHIIVLLRPQGWGFLTSFNKRRISTGFQASQRLSQLEGKNKELAKATAAAEQKVTEQKARIASLEAQVQELK